MISVEFHNTVDDSPAEVCSHPVQIPGEMAVLTAQGTDTYECPGGRREAGEKIEHTARRELYEETKAAWASP